MFVAEYIRAWLMDIMEIFDAVMSQSFVEIRATHWLPQLSQH